MSGDEQAAAIIAALAAELAKLTLELAQLRTTTDDLS